LRIIANFGSIDKYKSPHHAILYLLGNFIMNIILLNTLTMIDKSLGRCPYCMKTAFLTAIGSWIIAVCASAVSAPEVFQYMAWFAAAGSTALWAAHFVTYWIRVAVLLHSETAVVANSTGRQAGTTRRALLRLGAQAFSIGVVASVWLPISAFAAGHKCGTGYCPDSAPNCCNRSRGKCCNGNWACTKTASCHKSHSSARKKCGKSGIVWACV